MNKDSNMAVFRVAAENSNDEITHFQMGCYVSSNEAMWHIFSFLMYERLGSLGRTSGKWLKDVLYND